ncbi:MAG: hypothetical protein IJ250_01160 [Bacteroidales bacterium]|nr:hypothetical protein [Bacteroidales bacterium]
MKYILRKYSGIESKLTCPSCGRHHCFTPYIDIDTQEIIDAAVGMCDHKNSCGYHLPPREFFQNNRLSYNFLQPQNYSKNLTPLKNIFTPSKFAETPLKNIKTPLNFYKTPSFADSYRNCREFSDKQGGTPTGGFNNFENFDSYSVIDLKYWQSNNSYYRFVGHHLRTYMVANNIFSHEQINRSSEKLGVSGGKSGETVFWQFAFNKDALLEIRTAKIITYDRLTGHRRKDTLAGVKWLHSELIKKEKLNKDFNLCQVPFGMKQFAGVLIDNNKKVNVFEAEKTAFAADIISQNEYYSLSVGSMQNFTSRILKPLKDIGITAIEAYPDKGCYNNWLEKSHQIENELNIKITLSNCLENHPQLKDGEDIADLLL